MNFKLLKVLGVLFFDFYGNIYRINKSRENGDELLFVVAILSFFTAGFIILWIYDLIAVIFDKEIPWPSGLFF